MIILLGALQGFVISALLSFGKARQYSHRLLAFLILFISLACLNMYLLIIGVANFSVFWKEFSMLVPLVMAMPLGPLIYFYVQSLLEPTSGWQKKNWIHFFPILLDLLPRLMGAVYLIGITMRFIVGDERISWINTIDKLDMYIDVPRWISISTYLFFAWRLTKRDGIKTDDANLKWTKQFVFAFIAFQTIWFLHLIPYVTPSLSDDLIELVNWYPVYIPLAVMVYWLGIKGFFLRSSRGETAKGLLLSNKVVDDTKVALLKSMEHDHLYLDPGLTLNTLVSHTGIAQKVISSVLNQQMGKSFNEFVNDYRIEAVKQKLHSGNQHLTITGIAFECGFNSQATFQRVFKQTTGLTPTEFVARNVKTA